MNSSLPTKGEVLVIGGTGSIGWPICRALIAQGYQVTALTRGIHQRPEGYVPGSHDKATLREVNCSVTSIASDRILDDVRTIIRRPLSAIIYAVGDCPPGKFDTAVEVPLCDIDDGILSHELTIHVVGLLNVVRKLHPCLQPSGHIVVISSAITRLTDASCPPWLHAGHYAAAKAAQDELVRWFRRDPNIKDQNILVHRLAPAAVDTPFHQGCQHQPPAMLSVDDVANRVIDCLQSTTVIDEMLMVP